MDDNVDLGYRPGSPSPGFIADYEVMATRYSSADFSSPPELSPTISQDNTSFSYFGDAIQPDREFENDNCIQSLDHRDEFYAPCTLYAQETIECHDANCSITPSADSCLGAACGGQWPRDVVDAAYHLSGLRGSTELTPDFCHPESHVTNEVYQDPSSLEGLTLSNYDYVYSQLQIENSLSPLQDQTDIIRESYHPESHAEDGDMCLCRWTIDEGKYCDHSCASKEELQSHVLKEHIDSIVGKQNFICRWKDCNRPATKPPFTQRSKLERHCQSHTGFKACHCEFCGKSFSTTQTLSTHYRTHTGDRPYECKMPGCDYKAAQASQLTMHQRTRHTKLKPLSCEVCGATFAESSNLSKHRKTHVKTVPQHCPKPGCGKVFDRPDQLKRHLKNHKKGKRSSSSPEQGTPLDMDISNWQPQMAQLQQMQQTPVWSMQQPRLGEWQMAAKQQSAQAEPKSPFPNLSYYPSLDAEP